MSTKATIASDAMVIQDAKLVGKIYIGSGTVVHPKTLINAKDGEIQIGKNNIIEEGAVIENLYGF